MDLEELKDYFVLVVCHNKLDKASCRRKTQKRKFKNQKNSRIIGNLKSQID